MDDEAPKRGRDDGHGVPEAPDARLVRVQGLVASGVSIDGKEDEDPRSYWHNFQEDWDANLIFD